jgi:heterodisulfide reductase subunit B
MLMTTYEEIALNLNNHILQCAEDNGADVIATACPLCQMNLEAYQEQINQRYGLQHHIPVVYFTQLTGLALGIEPKALGMDTLLIDASHLKAKPKAARKAV